MNITIKSLMRGFYFLKNEQSVPFLGLAGTLIFVCFIGALT